MVELTPAGHDGETEGGARSDRGGPSAQTPKFSVRFETHDDFLVVYTDQLRHGIVRLPLPQPLAVASAVRLRLHLPDRSILYLRGTTAEDAVGVGEDTTIGLEPLADHQLEALDGCLEAILGRSSDSNGQLAPLDEEPISVLVVDDSIAHRLQLGEALRDRGFRVRVAENGLLALSAALKRVPDVILADVEMPQMDGWSLLRSVRKRKRLMGVPVVFLTRLADELSRLRGYRMGVDDFLPKTMEPDEVAARVRGSVTRRRRFPGSTASNATRGLRGDLEHVRLGSLLAFLESERRSGALYLRRGSDRAVLHIAAGGLSSVENLGRYAHPNDRVFEMLDWSFGQFEFLAAAPGETASAYAGEDHTPLTYLLMEHARRRDEAGA